MRPSSWRRPWCCIASLAARWRCARCALLGSLASWRRSSIGVCKGCVGNDAAERDGPAMDVEAHCHGRRGRDEGPTSYMLQASMSKGRPSWASDEKLQCHLHTATMHTSDVASCVCRPFGPARPQSLAKTIRFCKLASPQSSEMHMIE